MDGVGGFEGFGGGLDEACALFGAGCGGCVETEEGLAGGERVREGEHVQGEVDFVVEAFSFHALVVTAGDCAGAESGPPFDVDFFDECHVDVFAGDGFAAEGQVEAREVL